MAITRILVQAIPTENTSDEVEDWNLGMTYSQGTEGTSDYYENSFEVVVHAIDKDVYGAVIATNFTELDKTAWSLADLKALCPTSKWDDIFNSQYENIITTPPEVCTPDNEFEIPTE